MSLEHDLARAEPGSVTGLNGSPRAPPAAHDYWHALIDEKKGGSFLGLSDRAMQAMRQKGDGPKFIRISSRCIRYRRIDLKAWAEARMRKSTSDPGLAAA